MKKFFLITVLAFALPLFTALAQKSGKIAFEKTSHDFGQIKEENGPVEVSFSFTNAGNGPLVLTDVKASCGCTTPDWSREPIQPGAKGFVKASYNPQNRPGEFQKSVTVRTDGDPQVVLLRIEGNVEPRPKGVADWYPAESGNLRFTSTHIGFGQVLHDGTASASVLVYNQGKQPVNLDLANTRLPAHLSTTIENASIAPEDTFRLHFSFDANLKKDWGRIFENFSLVTDDTDSPEKRMYVSADIRENFGDLSQAGEKPVVSLNKLQHNFGDMAQSTTAATTFTLTNEGNAPLIIRKTKASCGCTATKPQKTTLAPGESTEIDVSFNSGTRDGQQKKSVTVITNDPTQDVITLWIEANVLKEESNSGE